MRFIVHAGLSSREMTVMSELPVDENAPGPSRPLSDFMSLERFAEFNAETRRLRREFVLEEEELAARALSRTTGSSLYMRPRPFVYLINPEVAQAGVKVLH